MLKEQLTDLWRSFTQLKGLISGVLFTWVRAVLHFLRDASVNPEADHMMSLFLEVVEYVLNKRGCLVIYQNKAHICLSVCLLLGELEYRVKV